MTSDKVLETLKSLRYKYSNRREKPEWYNSASDEEKERYDKLCDERYDALAFAVRLVKSYRALETAKNSINEVLDIINEVNEDE